MLPAYQVQAYQLLLYVQAYQVAKAASSVPSPCPGQDVQQGVECSISHSTTSEVQVKVQFVANGVSTS